MQERSKYYLEERLGLLVVVLSGAGGLVVLVLRYLAVPAAEPDGDAAVLKAPAAALVALRTDMVVRDHGAVEADPGHDNGNRHDPGSHRFGVRLPDDGHAPPHVVDQGGRGDAHHADRLPGHGLGGRAERPGLYRVLVRHGDLELPDVIVVVQVLQVDVAEVVRGLHLSSRARLIDGHDLETAAGIHTRL